MAFDKLKYRISADASDFKRELKEANTAFERFQRKNRSSMRMMRGAASGAAGGVAAIGAAATTAAAGLTVLSVRAAAKFESSIADAGAKAQATAAQMREMEGAAFKASSTSAFSAQDAAESMGNLAQAGLTVKQQLAALPGTLTLAAAGNVELGEASSIAVKSLKAFRLEAESMGRVGDVLSKAATSSNTSITELGEALANAGGIAGEMGQTIESTVSVISSMQDVGIQAAKAGTAVRSALARLAEKGGQAQRVIEGLGVEVRDSNGRLRQFGDILADMADKGADADQFIQAFGKRIGPNIVAATAKGAQGIRDFTASLEAAGGTAQQIADRQLDNAAGQIKIMTGSLETLGIVAGKIITPALKGLATDTNAWVNDLRANDEALDDLRETFGDLAAMAGGALELLGHSGEVLANIIGTLSFQFGAAYEMGDQFRESLVGLGDKMQKFGADIRTGGTETDNFGEKLGDLGGRLAEIETTLRKQNMTLAKRALLQNEATRLEAAIDLTKEEERVANLKEQASTQEHLNKMLGERQQRLAKVKQTRDEIRRIAENAGVDVDALNAVGGQVTGGTIEQRQQIQMLQSAWQQVQAKHAEARKELERTSDAYSKAVRADAELAQMGIAEDVDTNLEGPKVGRPKIDSGKIKESAEEAKKKFLEGFEGAFGDAPINGTIIALGERAEQLAEKLGKIGGGQFVQNLDRLKMAFAEGRISVEEYARGLDRVRESANAFTDLQAGAARLEESLKGPWERAQEAIAEYRKMLEGGMISRATFDQARGQAIEAANAERFKDAREKQKEHIEEQKRQAEEWKQHWQNAAIDAFSTTAQAGIDSFFAHLNGETEDAIDGLKELGKALLKIGARAAIQGAFMNGGGGGAGADGLMTSMGSILNLADGGHVRGPGTSTSDSIPARLSNNEYVMKAKATEHFGVGFMDAVNNLRFPASPQKFASGGLVKSGGGGVNLTLNNITDPKDIERAMASSTGDRVIWNFIERHADEIAMKVKP